MTVDEMLAEANATLEPIAAERLYLRVRDQSKAAENGLLAYANATRQLAYLASNEVKRSSLWKDGYKALSATSHESDVLFVEQAAIFLRDIIVDQYSGVDLPFQSRELARLLRVTAGLIAGPTLAANDRSRLLARRSSLLRLRGEHFDLSKRTKEASLLEAIRCAEKAIAESETTGAQFELALCIWANAESAGSDEAYRETLDRVERLLSSPHILRIEVAKLTRAKFYRSIYSPFDACETFQQAVETATHRRRLLGDVFVYAEAAIQLWFQKFPDATWRSHCESALIMTRSAIDAGYKTARSLVNLAYLHEILGQQHAATTAIRELADVPVARIWDKLIEFSSSPELDEATEGLCFGIAEGAVWTRLGTYAWKFSNDVRTAKALYTFAAKLSPHDPVVLTNLGRFYLRSEENEENYIEAEKLLSRAASYAGRRFRWCRLLLDELRLKRDDAQQPARPAAPRPLPAREALVTRLSSVKSRYKNIKTLENPQRRGYELEALVFDLANISFSVAARAYRLQRGDTGETQVDGYIEHRSDKYRIECKWEKDPVSKDAFVKFFDALDVAGVSGLFISMTGFAPSFLQRAREYRKERAVILFDREDIELAITGKANFDELLTFKRLSFDKSSEPYAKFVPFQD